MQVADNAQLVLQRHFQHPRRAGAAGQQPVSSAGASASQVSRLRFCVTVYRKPLQKGRSDGFLGLAPDERPDRGLAASWCECGGEFDQRASQLEVEEADFDVEWPSPNAPRLPSTTRVTRGRQRGPLIGGQATLLVELAATSGQLSPVAMTVALASGSTTLSSAGCLVPPVLETIAVDHQRFMQPCRDAPSRPASPRTGRRGRDLRCPLAMQHPPVAGRTRRAWMRTCVQGAVRTAEHRRVQAWTARTMWSVRIRGD